MPFDLFVFTKKYNIKVVEMYSKNKYYKEGMDILYKGIYTIINNIIDKKMNYEQYKNKKRNSCKCF